MGACIIVCGLNGAGKSTLGKALAERLDFRFLDIEDLYFPKADSVNPYAAPRTQAEVEKLLLEKARGRGNFVLAAVKGDYGADLRPFFKCAVLIEVPRDERIRRVRARSHAKFGDRILPGGDLYDQENSFMNHVLSRSDSLSEDWALRLGCPVIRIDGTLPTADNAAYLARILEGDEYGFMPEKGQ